MVEGIRIVTNPAEIEHSLWDSFVERHLDGNSFQTPSYYDVLIKTKLFEPVFICLTDRTISEIYGIVLGAIQRDYHGPLGYLTRRCFIVGGPLLSDKVDSILLNQVLQELKNELRFKVLFTQFQFFKKPDPEFLEIYRKNGFYYEEYQNILVDTSLSKEDLWKFVKRNRKDGVNKGKRQNFEFYECKDREGIFIFYDLLYKMYKRIKKPIPPLEYFQSMQSLIPENEVLFFNLRFHKEIIVSLMCLKYNSRLFAYYIGIKQDAKLLNLKPVDFFYWQVIQWCHDNNIRYFDWMGAGKKNEPYGVRDFKIQFGGELFENGRMSRFSNRFLGLVIKTALKYYWKRSHE